MGAGKLERRKEARLAKEEETEFLQKKIFYFFLEGVLNHECRGAYFVEGYREVFVWFGGKATGGRGALSGEATSYRKG